MKHFILLKLSILLLGTAAALLLTPACKAQSEISPDHFDGTDSWAKAPRQVHAQPQKQAAAQPSVLTKSQKEPKNAAFQVALAGELTKPARRETVAIDPKRKPATPNSGKP